MTHPDSRTSWRQGLPLLCCLAAFALLVLTLEAQSIWWDEGISLHLAELPWREIIDDRAANIHPPLYFFLLKVWTGVVGHTPFTGRYLSSLATVLLPAVAYRFMRDRFGGQSARAAAFLVSFAPPFIVYGQETRAYALLTLGVILLWDCVWPARKRKPIGRCPGGDSCVLLRGLKLGLVQVSLLLLHYAGALAVAVAALGYGFQWVRQRSNTERSAARAVAMQWLVGAGVTGLLILPWVGLVLTRGVGGVTRQAGLNNALAEPVPADYVIALMGIFHLVGLPEALGMPRLMRLAPWLALLTAVGTMVVLCRSKRRRSVAVMSALWLIPLLAAPMIWTLSPQSHPRYLFAFIVGGWLLVAAVVGDSATPQLLRWALLAVASVSNLLGLHAYFVDPNVARSDIRAVAAFIQASAKPGDVALVPHTDWSLAQYDLGNATLASAEAVVAQPDGRTLLGLDAIEGSRVFALDYGRGALDPRDAVRAALTWEGVLTERRPFNGAYLEIYELYGVPEVPGCLDIEPVCAVGTDLCLTGARLSPAPVSGGVVPVALCWEKGADVISRYGAAVQLVGPQGAFISADNDLLLDVQAAPTDFWSAGRVASYHLLPLQVGALPLPHEIRVGLYDALAPDQPVTLVGRALSGYVSAVPIGQVTPALSPWRTVSLYGLDPLPAGPSLRFTPSLHLIGAELDRQRVQPGERLFVSLRWNAQEAEGAQVRPQLVLHREGVQLATVDSAIGSLTLPVGRPRQETLSVAVPPDAASGEAAVMLCAADVAHQIGDVTISGAQHLFEAPDLAYQVDAAVGTTASLVGFDLDPGVEIVAGESLTVTLVWRAGPDAADQDLKVFVHLITGDDELVAQDDAKPAEWSRPTLGWITGEMVIDSHILTWKTTEGAGSAYLRVGFYDEATGERLVWSNGADAYELPVALSIEPSHQ